MLRGWRASRRRAALSPARRARLANRICHRVCHRVGAESLSCPSAPPLTGPGVSAENATVVARSATGAGTAARDISANPGRSVAESQRATSIAAMEGTAPESSSGSLAHGLESLRNSASSPRPVRSGQMSRRCSRSKPPRRREWLHRLHPHPATRLPLDTATPSSRIDPRTVTRSTFVACDMNPSLRTASCFSSAWLPASLATS